MPIYNYECGCGKKFELLRPMRQSGEKAPCPSCFEDAVQIVSSLRKCLVAHPFVVFAHDGTILHSTQTTERTPVQVRTKSGKVVNA